MAFSKMAGLDVMPRKPSSLIIFFRSPLSKMLRRMKSSHGDWPYASKPFNGFAPCAALMLGMVVVVVMLLLLLYRSLCRTLSYLCANGTAEEFSALLRSQCGASL